MTTTTFDMNDLKRRMQGAIASLKQELVRLAHRTRFDGIARSRPGRGLWQPHAAQSARHDQRAGAAAAQRAGLGPLDGACGREGDLGGQSRPDAVDRRARCCGCAFRSSTRSGAGKSSRSRTNTPKPRASRCATSAATASICSRSCEKDHKISEDDHNRQAGEVQKATDATIADVEKMLAGKEKEIMTV